MKTPSLSRIALLLLCACAAAAPLAAQQPTPPPARCQPPALAAAPRAHNIFAPRQEMELGDAIAEHVQRNFRVVEDDEVAGHLRRVGERLVARLPASEMRYQFFLFDLPVANAFALPGGRIYVSRKMVAFARTEDELASVLAHELGHIASGQTAADMTRMMREVLGVTEVKDRGDILDKYNQLVENSARKPEAFRRGDKHEEREQLEADQIGLYAMAAAGYDPQAFAAFWDRFAETRGKTGGYFSDLFGVTKPESRRLREILKGLAALPAECRPASGAGSPAEFEKWQAAVINYSGLGRKEALHSVASKRVLEPPLRGDITHLRFSPDGQFVLAQDDSGINVLAREPSFAPVFRIEAPEAHPAQFTPDGKSVVFHNSALRVETWDVGEEKLRSVREMFVRGGCMQSALAPDAQTLACLDTDYALALYDVATGAQLFQKKGFFKPDLSDLFRLIFAGLLDEGDSGRGSFEWVSMAFSPDARYFAAGERSLKLTAMATVSQDVSAVIYDLTSKTTLPAKGQLKKLLSNRFAFVGADRIVGIDPEDGRKSALLSFPSGELVEQFALGGTPDAVTRGNYVLLRPIQGYAVGVFDLAAKKIFMANKQSAFDIHGDVFVSERVNGELGLYRVEGQEMVEKVLMPRGSLGRLRAATVSPDLKWLAVSERSRGGVWNLDRGERVFHVRGFRGAHFAPDGSLRADFPAHQETKRTIARLDLAGRQVFDGAKVEEDVYARQRGPYLLLTRPLKKGGNLRENVQLEVRDATTGTTLWTRDFAKEAPGVSVDAAEGALILSWAVKSGAAKAEIKADPALAQQLTTLGEKEGDYLLQVLDGRTGKVAGSLLVETGKGSFRIESLAVAGDLVVLSDTENRVLVYTLSKGTQRGRVFGDRPAVSKAANLLSVESERGQLTVYDLATVTKRDQFTFSSPVALARFSADGKQLFVLTANQTAYVLDLSPEARAND